MYNGVRSGIQVNWLNLFFCTMQLTKSLYFFITIFQIQIISVDTSNESNKVFFKRSDVPNSTMNEPNTNND